MKKKLDMPYDDIFNELSFELYRLIVIIHTNHVNHTIALLCIVPLKHH